MTSEGVNATLTALGGADVLAHLQRTHDELGPSLGVSAPMSVPAPGGPVVASELESVQAFLREYVLKVFAMVNPEIAGSEAVAAALLAPLVEAAAAASRARKAARPRGRRPRRSRRSRRCEKPANDVTPAVRPTGTG